MIKIKTDILRDALSKAIKACSFSKMLPLTELMEIKVESNELSVRSTDGVTNLIVKNQIEGNSNGDNNMRVVVEARIITDLVNKITTENVELSSDKNALTIVGNGVYQIKVRVDESGEIISYPVLNVDMSKAVNEINLKLLATKIEKCKSAVPENFIDPEFNYFYLKENVVTSDTMKIAIVENNEELKNTEMYLKPAFATILSSMDYDKAKFYVEGNTLVIVNDNITLVTQSNEKDIENLNKFRKSLESINMLVDSNMKYKATINKGQILSLLDRLSLFITEYEEFSVIITFLPDKMILNSTNNDGKEEILFSNAETEGLVEFTKRLDVNDLKMQLAVLDSEEVEVQFDETVEMIKVLDKGITQITAYKEDNN